MRCRGNSEPFPNSIYIYIFRILLRKGNPTVSFIHYDTAVIYFQILETPEEYIPQFLWMFEDQKLKIMCRISKTKLHNYPHVFMLLALYWTQTLHLNVWRPWTMENSCHLSTLKYFKFTNSRKPTRDDCARGKCQFS